MDWDGFHSWLIRQGYKQNTIKTALDKLAFVVRFCGGQLTEVEINRFIVKRRASYTNNSINQYLKAVKLYGKYTSSEPLVSIKLLPKNHTAKATLTLDELSRFLAIKIPLSNHSVVNYWMLFALSALTGMRLGEVAHLTVDDISFGEGLIYLSETKTDSPRKVPIPSNLIEPLQKHLKKCGKVLFPGANPQGWGKAFHHRLKLARIESRNLRPHSLRSTYITHQLRIPGVNLFDVKSLVGHHNTATTEIYYNEDGERLKSVVAKHPIVAKTTTKKEKARYLSDVIRSFGIDYEPKLIEQNGKLFVKVEIV